MKTMYIVLGVVAIGGVLWYVRNKKQAPSAAALPAETAPQVPSTPAPKIIKLPDSVLINTSGNTGIVPPLIMDPSKTAPTIKIGQPMRTPINKQTQLQGYQMD